jgi:hypothetical protein
LKSQLSTCLARNGDGPPMASPAGIAYTATQFPLTPKSRPGTAPSKPLVPQHHCPTGN